MKQAAEYAKRINRLFNTLRRQHGKVEPPTELNPIEQLILAILARNTSDAKAQLAYHRLRENMVDNNELRVTPPGELAEVLGHELPDPVNKAKALLDALNAVYDRQNAMDLSFLKGMSVRDARDCLRSLTGVDEFAAARVVLLSLGGHAIPVDEHTAYVLRKEDLVGAEATIEEIQAFLERHIHATEGITFSSLIRKYAATKAPKAVPPPPKAEKPKTAHDTPEKAKAAPDTADKVKAVHEAAEKTRATAPPAKKGKEDPAHHPSAASKTPPGTHVRTDKKARPDARPVPKTKPARK